MGKDVLRCSAVLPIDSRQLHIVCATFEELPAQHGRGSGAYCRRPTSSCVLPLKRFRLLSGSTKKCFVLCLIQPSNFDCFMVLDTTLPYKIRRQISEKPGTDESHPIVS